MPMPRMTTRRWILAVVVLAVWLGFVARAERLRGIGTGHMRLYTAQTRMAIQLNEQRKSDEAAEARAQAASHLKIAERNNVEADFVESFTATLLVAVVLFGVVVFVRNRRRPPRENDRAATS